MKIRQNAFTLIELLMVTAVIAILAGMLFPAFKTVMASSKKHKAKSEMNSIITAIKAYESTYGVLPITKAGSTSYDGANLTDDQYDQLIELLTCVDGPYTGTTYNVRNIKFLDAPSTYGTTKPYKGPWDARYQIYLDHDYDGKCNVNDAGTAETSTETNKLNGSVFILSPEITSGQFKHSLVCSWR